MSVKFNFEKNNIFKYYFGWLIMPSTEHKQFFCIHFSCVSWGSSQFFYIIEK